MDKEYIREEFGVTVLPGWWGILLKYLPQIQEIDPLVKFEIKEKRGALDIFMDTDAEEGYWNRDTIMDMGWLVSEAEKASMCTCMYCGAPGTQRSVRGWIETTCARCARLSDDGKWAVSKETERKWMVMYGQAFKNLAEQLQDDEMLVYYDRGN